jgi:quercetin dioxygenase-like cupin family protein
MKTRIAVIGAVLAAVLVSASLIFARETGEHKGVSAEQVLAETLGGDPSKEVYAQIYTFPAGTVLPWHIHPDAHEIAYVLEGNFTFERAGEAPEEMAAGKAEYLVPNAVHRGLNKTDKPVRLFVVRIKPKAKPLVEEVPPPQ